MTDGVFLATTNGVVPGLTVVSLLNPYTGNNAVIPAGSCIQNIFIYRDQSMPVTNGLSINLGISGNTSKYIGLLDGISTTLLNSSTVVNKNIIIDSGSSNDVELKLTLGGTLLTGVIVFRITYTNYS